MALIKTTDLPGSLRSTDKVTKQRAVARCITEEFGPAKSNADKFQIMREWEVLHPEIIQVNGENKVLAGSKVKQYIGVRLNKEGTTERDGAQSDALLARFRDEQKLLGFPHEEIDDENPELLCEGTYADIMLDSDEFNYKDPVTPEEAALGKKFGANTVGPDGKPVVGYKLKLAYVLGPATPVAGQPW